MVMARIDKSASLRFSFSEMAKSVGCFVCNEVFEDKDLLKIHILGHTERSVRNEILTSSSECIKPYEKCDGEILPVREILKTYQTKYLNSGLSLIAKKLYACLICTKKFKRKDHFQKHYATHTGLRPFICLVCNKKFARKDRLKEHCTVHQLSGWSCYFCGKMFSQRCVLRKHELIHKGVKPFFCELCNSRFSRKNDMLRHRISHTNEKPYFCEVCEKRFSQKRLLNRHSTLHLKTLV